MEILMFILVALAVMLLGTSNLIFIVGMIRPSVLAGLLKGFATRLRISALWGASVVLSAVLLMITGLIGVSLEGRQEETAQVGSEPKVRQPVITESKVEQVITTKPKSEVKVSTKQSHGKAQAGSSTDIPSYTIIEDDNLAHFWRSVRVRLSEKASIEALRSISLKIKSIDRKNYDRTFISYCLPGKEESGAWATSHFDPDLDVRIYGLTIKEEAIFRDEAVDPTWEVVGSWFVEDVSGEKRTIYKLDDILYMETGFPAIGAYSVELTELPAQGERMFETKSGSDIGEFYLIDQHGHLQFWGRNGHFATAWKID